MRKSLIAMFLAAAIGIFSPMTTYALSFDPPTNVEIQAEGVYLVNLDTDTVVYEKNGDKKMYPASMTKVMTAIVTMENIDDLQKEITYPFYLQDIIYQINWTEYGGALSTAGLLGGETLTAEKLLYGAMLPSGNECAYILADHVGDGSVEYFVEMMNEKAQEIGAVNTHFANPAGLDDEENYSTPHDMYLIAKYAMQNDAFKKIVSTPSFNGGPTNKHEELYWNNTNQMLNQQSQYYYSPVKGIKTGTLESSGRCFVSYAEKDGFSYMMVVMGAPMYDEQEKPLGYNAAFTTTKSLYQWAFSNFSIKTVIDEGEMRDEVKLRLARGKKDHLKLVTGESFTTLLPENVDRSSFQMVPVLPESVDAPVKEGDQIGRLKLMLAGEEIGSVPLLSGETVERSFVLFIIDTIVKMLQSFWFKFAFILVILLIAAYIIAFVRRNRRRVKYRNVRRKRNM